MDDMKEVLMSKPILANFVFLKTWNSKYTMRYIDSEQKIVLDWEHSGGFKGFTHMSWLKLKILMRTHIFLEPGENPNEKISSIYEEWGSNELLTEESLPWPPFLGMIHQKLRLFTGSLILSLARNIKSFM